MFALLTLLAYDREDLMVAALSALVVAGAVVAVGAWVLLFKQGRRGRGGVGRSTTEATGGHSPEPEPDDVHSME